MLDDCRAARYTLPKRGYQSKRKGAMMSLAYGNQSIYAVPFGGYKAGGYSRLSREDENKGFNVSQSIQNQKELILRYIKENPDLELVDFYEDDDFIGQNFERDGFERLLKDMETGRINMVITKDAYVKHLNEISHNYLW